MNKHRSLVLTVLSILFILAADAQQQPGFGGPPGLGAFFSNIGNTITNFFRRPFRLPGAAPGGAFAPTSPPAPTPPPVFFNVPVGDLQAAAGVNPYQANPNAPAASFQPSFQLDQQVDQSANQPLIQSSQQQPVAVAQQPAAAQQYQYVYVTETITVTKPSVCTTYRQQGNNVVVGG